jgi:chromosome segregation ATPase
MNNIQNVNPNIASTIAAQAGEAEQSRTAAQVLAPILSGQSVTVTSAAASDLEKLVAQLKNENADRKASMAKQRLASLLDVYAARYGELSAQQTQILEEIAANNDEIADLTEDLKKALADLAAAKGQSAAMEAQIESLERAVEQAVADGKAHRETIAKLKEQLAEDQDNEDLKARLEKEEKALETSEAARSKAETDLAAVQAAAGALSAKIESLAGSVEKLKGKIDALAAGNAALAAKLDPQTISHLLAALADKEPSAPAERNASAAEEEKAEKKAIANDPANILREAMDRMDESILRTIDENRDKTV